MLDDEFYAQMAALGENQREANARYASAMDAMAADLSAMSRRFEAEMSEEDKEKEKEKKKRSSTQEGTMEGIQKEDGTRREGVGMGMGMGMGEQMGKGQAVAEKKKKKKKKGRVDVKAAEKVG